MSLAFAARGRIRSGPAAVVARLLILAICAVACSSPEDRIEGHAARARSYAERGLHREALLEYHSALRIDPNRGDLHFGVAEAHRALGNEDAAFWELQETVRLDPENHTAKVYYAQTLALSSEPSVRAEALSLAREVTAAAPDNVAAWLAEGRALLSLERSEDAVSAFERALALEPGNGEVLRVLANAHAVRGDMELAEELYRRATEVDAGFLSWIATAQFLARQAGREEDAVAAYREAIAVARGSEANGNEAIRATDALAAFLYSRGRVDDAERVLSEGYQEQGRPPELLRSLARFYQMRGEPERAEAVVRQAAEQRPDEIGPQLTLASYLTDLGDLEGAERAVARALSIDPSDPEARLRQAHVVAERGRLRGDAAEQARGRALLDALIESEPPNLGRALVVRGRLEVASGELDAAVETLRRAIGLGADDARVHTLIGAALLPKHPRQARAELHRALERDPGSVDARLLLVQVHNRLGEPELAIRAGGAALDRAPRRTDLRLALAQSLVELDRLEEAAALLEAVPDDDLDAAVLYVRAGIHRRRGDVEAARLALLEADRRTPHEAHILEALLALDVRTQRLAESEERIAAAVGARPEDGELARLQGRVALWRGDVDGARALLERAIQLAPDHLPAYYDLAELYGRTGNADEALATYEAAAERQPNAHLRLLLGILHEQAGRLDAALVQYELAVEADPDLGAAKNNLAFLLAERREELDRALTLAQDAKRALPAAPGVADTLGWVLYQRESYASAIAYLQEAEGGLEPGDPVRGIVRYHLALAQEANGTPEQAIQTLERALAELDGIRGAQSGAEPGWAEAVRAMLARLRGA